MDFKQAEREDRRLVLLTLLGESDGATASVNLLHSALSGFGHRPSLDQVETDVAWLAEQGLVTRADTAGITVATLTQRGQDVIERRVVQPGVRRPAPGV